MKLIVLLPFGTNIYIGGILLMVMAHTSHTYGTHLWLYTLLWSLYYAQALNVPQWEPFKNLGASHLSTLSKY